MFHKLRHWWNAKKNYLTVKVSKEGDAISNQSELREQRLLLRETVRKKHDSPPTRNVDSLICLIIFKHQHYKQIKCIPIMLAKDSDNCEDSPLKILNLKNVDTNASISGSGKGGGENDNCVNFVLGNQRSNLSDTEESCGIIEEKTGEKFIVPEGYQILPKEFFQLEGIPPPLVSSSWLKLLNSDGESGEDSIPLAKLKNKIKRKKRWKKIVKSSVDSEDASKDKNVSKKRRKQKTDSEYAPINRKRGRPKKQSIEKITTSGENEIQNTKDEQFWENESDYSNLNIQNFVETEFTKEPEDSQIDTNFNDHDYYKRIENQAVEESGVENKEEKKKKRKAGVQGVKTGDSKISFPCLECGKLFSAASTLKCHQRIHNGTLLICPECQKGFISKYLLKCHMRIHNGDLLMCHKCGRGFTTSELLKVHSRAHTGDRPFVCNVCGKSFPTSSNMLQHKQIHNSEKRFLCSECGSSFVQKRCLDYHMLTHAEKKNICNVCGKLWARKSDLIEHMRVHTGVKPYCCSICPQKFSQASSLKRHQLVHMDIKPISCATCNKMFKCQEYYKRHLRKHEKEDYVLNDL